MPNISGQYVVNKLKKAGFYIARQRFELQKDLYANRLGFPLRYTLAKKY